MKKNLWDSTGKNLQTGEDTSRFNENRQFEDIRYDTYTSDELTELKEKLKGRGSVMSIGAAWLIR